MPGMDLFLLGRENVDRPITSLVLCGRHRVAPCVDAVTAILYRVVRIVFFPFVFCGVLPFYQGFALMASQNFFFRPWKHVA